MQQPALKLSEAKPISTKPPGLVAILGMLLWVATAAAYGYTRSDQDHSYLLASQTTSHEARQAGILELKQGQPVERQIAGGQSHPYSISLSAGQYLKVIVEQKGIDVVVRLFGPGGQKIADMDSPNGSQGPEP